MAALRNLLIELKPTLWPLRPASQNPFAAAPSVGRRVPAQGQPAAGCYLNQFQQFKLDSPSSFSLQSFPCLPHFQPDCLKAWLQHVSWRFEIVHLECIAKRQIPTLAIVARELI
jgi:hypothetical protein